MSDFEHVILERHDDVAFIKLNDPGTLNALTGKIAEDWLTAFQIAREDSRCIILGSVGRAFSSGANLTSGFTPGPAGLDAGAGLEKAFNPLILEIKNSPVPVVSAVRGPSVGVACGISLMADVIVAGKSAYFFQSFARIGLMVDGGASWILPRTIGRVRAMKMMMLAEKYHAEEAYRDGMVTSLVEDDAVDETAMDYARRLANGPTGALGLIRKAAWGAMSQSLEEALAAERDLQRVASRSPEIFEGVQAFMEKREPDFKGVK